MNISTHIANLLQRHQCVVVPNFGGFLIQHQPVRHNKNTQLFSPPNAEIRFNQNLKYNDELLLSTLVIEEQITFEQAQQKIDSFVNTASQSLLDHKSFIITNIGKLYMDNNDNLRFKPDKQQNYHKNSYGLPQLTLNEIDRTKQEREKIATAIQQKRKASPLAIAFMVFASILAISLATLLVLINHGTPKQKEYIQSNLGHLFNKETYQTPVITEPVQTQTSNTPIEEKLVNTKTADTLETPITTVEQQQETTPVIEPQTIAKPFHIVLGLFQRKASANNVVQKAKNAGYHQAKIIEGKKYYRVVIPFDSNQFTWTQAQQEVRKNVQPDAWVWETKYN